MRNLKKFLALVMAMMMTLSLMVTADAATSSKDLDLSDSNAVSAVFLEDIQVLTGMEVIKGYPDGSFRPQTDINRHQMATFIYRMTTGDTGDLKDIYLSEIAAEKFPDVKAEDSYAGYIGYCYVNGYIAGFPDGTFKPMNKVTGYQAMVMILRAMGYNNPADNFTGSDWQVLAASRARMNNLLVNIDKTSYSNTFSQPAPRELVAEMVFQGLIQPQVTYTSAFGYQRYGIEGGVLSSILNPTLGYQNFGLTNHKGIVVGNSYTGEPNLANGTAEGAPATKIGFSMDVSFDKSLNIGDDALSTGTYGWTVTGSVADAAINDDIEKAAYYYKSGLSRTLGDSATIANELVNEYGVTLAFQWDSDLSLFNHAVDVWYDYRGAANETATFDTTDNANANVSGSVTYKTNLTTYAVFDRAVKTKVVMGPTSNASAELSETDRYSSGDAINDLSAAVLSEGFAIRESDEAFFNYAFAPMTRANWGDDAVAANSAVSPIIANNGEDTYAKVVADTQSATDVHPLYLVISNTPGNVVDVVISLDMTLSKVVQDNNTQAPTSTGILTENDSVGDTLTYSYFDKIDQIDLTSGIGESYSNIADKNRVDDYNAQLGNYVAAIAITGTAPTQNNGKQTSAAASNAGDATEGNAVPAGTSPTGTTAVNLQSTYYFQMTQLTRTVTGTMVKFDQNTDTVHVNVNGETKVYDRSVFALATDGSFQEGEHVWAPRETGTYTFYLDGEDNWLFWEKAAPTSTFVYGTYIDWQTQPASSTFRYPFVYTNEEGAEKQQADITTVDGKSMSVSEYAAIMLPKRDTVTGSNSGFVRGEYIGYEMSGSALKSVTTTPGASGFRMAGTGDNDFGMTGHETTTITKDSVAIGAHPVTNQTVASGAGLFLTSRTKFIVVNGAGTDNQSVNVYNGLAEFLGTHKSVTIDCTAPIATDRYLENDDDNTSGKPGDQIYAGEDAPWEMVYYSTEEDPYSQNYNQMDKHIDTVFIPAQLIDAEDDVTGNLFFVGSDKYGLIDATNFATQYTFYQGAEESVRWIVGLPGADAKNAAGDTIVGTASDAKIIDDLGNNVFYQLHATGGKAVDGEPIYELIPFGTTEATGQDAADKAIIGQYYGYSSVTSNGADITANVGKTTVMADAHATTGYLATTRNSQVAYIGGRTAANLFNIASANVLNLDTSLTINSIGDLNDQSALTSNQGVDVSCVLGDTTAVINFIYVNCQ